MKTSIAAQKANKPPLCLEIGNGLIPLFDKEKNGDLLDRIKRSIEESGLIVPPTNIIDNLQLDDNEYRIKLNGVTIGCYKIKLDSFLCIDPGNVEHEASSDPQGIITTHMVKICKQRAPDLLSLQMTKEMLDDCREDHPFVVEEVLKCLSVPEIQRVLKNLLKENVSIRSLDFILESLAEFGPTTKDIRFLTERARQALAYQICDQYADQDRTIHVLTLEPSLEQMISDSKLKNSSGDICSSLEPLLHSAWIRSLGESVMTMQDEGHSPVILCSECTRYLVRTALEREFPEVAVLSVGEIACNYSVESVGIIEVKVEPVNEVKSVNERDILILLEKIYNETHECGIVNYRLEGKDHLDYVSHKLGISSLQAVLFSHFLAKSDNININIGEIADSVKCNKVKIIKYKNEINELEKKRLIRCKRTNKEITYRVPPGVSDSLIKNIEYKPIETTGLSIEKFFTALQQLLEERENGELTFETLTFELIDLIEMNMHLHFCKKIMGYNFSEEDIVLLSCFCHLSGNKSDDDIRSFNFEFLYDNKSEFRRIVRWLSNGSHLLIEKQLIEQNNDDGIRSSDSWKLSDKGKQELLEELDIKAKNYKKGLILFENIKIKKMFYNQRETTAINTLASLLQEENYRKILARLDAKGMRKGFACLFSGGPGTGKTETVFQIARETKRNIMAVDISETRSCWFGESEKKIKEIFSTYRKAVENSGITPILLFNEADAIINKRNSNEYTVSQTENRIQNIILQEMENLSGILIATTNLTGNMDSAFERRFLYKITFDRPGIEGRKGIWNALLPDFPEDKAIELSGRFDLSGGQIENIARKIEVDVIINGGDLAADVLVQYCKDEIENGFNSSKKIGFAS
jgi:SpoVK/Ycf46/Vps4 family AAA+-type ATPase